MNRWEVGTAVAAGVAFVAAACLYGVPALMHHGEVPDGEWLAATVSFLVGCFLFVASIVISAVSTGVWLRRKREDR